MFNGPINGTSFRAWVEQLRVLVLRPGDIVECYTVETIKRTL